MENFEEPTPDQIAFNARIKAVLLCKTKMSFDESKQEGVVSENGQNRTLSLLNSPAKLGISAIVPAGSPHYTQAVRPRARRTNAVDRPCYRAKALREALAAGISKHCVGSLPGLDWMSGMLGDAFRGAQA